MREPRRIQYSNAGMSMPKRPDSQATFARYLNGKLKRAWPGEHESYSKLIQLSATPQDKRTQAAIIRNYRNSTLGDYIRQRMPDLFKVWYVEWCQRGFEKYFGSL